MPSVAPSALERCVALACVVALLLPGLAQAAPVPDAQAAAQQGAALFKAGQYHDAALAFERAWQLEPSDPRHLRYAGRAWQEVGHLQRARLLLERYLEIEPDPALRQSIEDKLAPLRTATPLAIAEALDQATQRFAQARLEADAAKAFELVGDEAALRRAARLWEVARLGARDVAERETADAGVRRVQQALRDLSRAPTPAPVETVPVDPGPVDPGPVEPGSAEPVSPPPRQPEPAPPSPAPSPGPQAAVSAPIVSRSAPAATWRRPVGLGAVIAGGAVLAVGAIVVGVAYADGLDYDERTAEVDAQGRIVGFGTDAGAPGRAKAHAERVNDGYLLGGLLAGAGALLAGTGGVLLRSGQTEVAVRPIGWQGLAVSVRY